jgi:GT2 family glycosyltransferase
MVSAERFRAVGGFNEHYFTHYQDVDLCLKLAQLSLRNIYTPSAKLIHHESVSRKEYYDLVDRNLLLDQWQADIEQGDAFYNPNFDIRAYNYTLRVS